MGSERSLRFLFMEDDQALARLLQKKLERLGNIVDLAPNGEVGLRMCGEQKYDLIIVDHRMPIYSGLDVIRELSRQKDAPPSIMVTGAGDERIAVQALKLGAYDYVVKDAASGYMELLPTVIDQVFAKKRLEYAKNSAEQALKESESRYRSLVEMSPDTILVMIDDQIRFVNDAGMRLMGAASVDEIIGRTEKDLVAPAFLESFRDSVNPCGQGQFGNVARFESRFSRLDGSELDVELKVASIEYSGHHATQLAIRDISARKKAEMEISQMNDELEQMVDDQNLQLESLHTEMEDASKKLNMAQMATGALHNVKNVLNSLIVGTSMMTKILANSKVGKVSKVSQLLLENQSELGTFLTEGDRGRFLPNFLSALAQNLEKEHDMIRQELTGLTKNLEHIKFSIQLQLASTRLSDSSEFLSLNDLVEDALKVNRSTIQRQSIRIQRSGATMPPIPGNKHKVLQVLVNMVTNAIHALEDNSPEDRVICLSLEMTKNDQAAVTVKDNGVGISKESLDELFSFGFTTKKTGHGFGLHSCLQLASEMGGQLTAHSEGLGKGASFTLSLPLPKMDDR